MLMSPKILKTLNCTPTLLTDIGVNSAATCGRASGQSNRSTNGALQGPSLQVLSGRISHMQPGIHLQPNILTIQA